MTKGFTLANRDDGKMVFVKGVKFSKDKAAVCNETEDVSTLY